MRQYILLVVFLIFTSCNKIKAQKVKEKNSYFSLDSTISEKQTIINFNLDSLRQVAVKKELPYGKKELLEFEFPAKRWLFYGGWRQKDDRISESEKRDSIQFAWKYDTIGNFNIADINTTINNKLPNRYKRFFNKIYNKQNNISYNYLNIKNLPSNIIEFPKYRNFNVFGVFMSFQKGRIYKELTPLFIVLDEKGNYIDNLNSSRGCDDVNCFSKLVYVDKNYVFHFKHFLSDEGVTIQYIKNEKYKISSEGNFVRFYDENGMYNSEDEVGLIVENKRQGEWLEFVYDPHLSYPKYYLESKFNKGKPTGIWRYYDYPYITNKTKHSITNKSKGLFQYTEVYKDGKLVKREFIKEPN